MGKTQQQDSSERTYDGGMCMPQAKDAQGPQPRDSCSKAGAGGRRQSAHKGGGGSGCGRNDRRVKKVPAARLQRKPRSVSEDSTSSATSATSANSSSTSSSSPEISRARDAVPPNHRHHDSGESRSPRRRQQHQQRRRPCKASKKNERPKRGNPRGAACEGFEEPTAEEKSKYVALDCEMVGVGEDGQTSALARVSIVDWDAHVLLDVNVQVLEEITDYRTFVSGVRADDLKEENGAVDPDECRRLVAGMLRDKVIVGHGLKCDLAALGLTHPWYDVRDTAKYAPFMKPHPTGDYAIPRKLRDLTSQYLRRTIQEEGREHSSVEDAIAAMDLFKAARVKWEKVIEWKVNRTREIEEANDRMQRELELEVGRTTSPAEEALLQPQLSVAVQ